MTGLGGRGGESGRLAARPTAGSHAAAGSGLQPLGLGERRDGLFYVPPGSPPDRPAPLVLMLHGAGGDARGGLAPFLDAADADGLVLLAPESRASTWDVIRGGFGPDVAFIDAALERVFERRAVDEARIAVEGFSDGASYALSLGLTNGDLFTHVMAFSPGFMKPAAQVGWPLVFVAHGKGDRVLPIDRCSRVLVPELRRAGYDVRYEEFDGPHTVPRAVTGDALAWFLG